MMEILVIRDRDSIVIIPISARSLKQNSGTKDAPDTATLILFIGINIREKD